MQISIREGHVYVLGGKTAIPIRDLNGLNSSGTIQMRYVF